MSALIVRAGGGLGNQMFNYAVGLRLAKECGRKLILDRTEFFVVPGRQYGLHNFIGPAQTHIAGRCQSLCFILARILQRFGNSWCRKFLSLFGYELIMAEDAQSFAPEFDRVAKWNERRNPYLAGCYGWLSYMSPRDLLKQQFKLTNPLSNGSKHFHDEIISAGESSVSLHVRRTDYLLPANGVPVLNPNYYDAAMAEILREIPCAHWFVFSDDISWCREHFKSLENVTYVDGNETRPWEDIALMSHCHHHIIANSTFSWWGAYLSDEHGLTICPRNWFSGCLAVPGVMVPEHWKLC